MISIPDRPQSITNQDEANLDLAEVELERAIKTLKRIRQNYPNEAHERAETILHIVQAVYVSIREIEWRRGIPSEAELKKVSEYLDTLKLDTNLE